MSVEVKPLIKFSAVVTFEIFLSVYKLIILSIFLRSECFAVRDDFRLSTVKYPMFRSKALDIIILYIIMI